MLGTDPGSKFQGASFLFQQFWGPKIEFGGSKIECLGPKSKFWVPKSS